MDSLPVTSYWVGPSALTAVDSKRALGNCATLNHTGLGISASASREPRVALPVSTVKAMRLAAGVAGSKATWASNTLN